MDRALKLVDGHDVELARNRSVSFDKLQTSNAGSFTKTVLSKRSNCYPSTSSYGCGCASTDRAVTIMLAK
jgi:hypothetical protein